MIAIAEVSPTALDREVFALAVSENRLLVTEDKDFGEIFYSFSLHAGNQDEIIGVILLRFQAKPEIR